MYPISQRAGWSAVAVSGSATSSPRHTICCYGAGQASKLSTCYLYTGTPPHYSWTDVCVLMSPISLVVAPAHLLYAQFVTRYRSHVWLAIDIAISAYRYNPYLTWFASETNPHLECKSLLEQFPKSLRHITELHHFS